MKSCFESELQCRILKENIKESWCFRQSFSLLPRDLKTRSFSALDTHGVNVPFDQIVFLWLQHQVVSSERNDARLPAAARYLRQSVRVEAPAGQHVAAAHLVTLAEWRHWWNARRPENSQKISSTPSVLPSCLWWRSDISSLKWEGGGIHDEICRKH